MNTDRNQDRYPSQAKAQSVSFVLTARYGARKLDGLSREILAWADQVGVDLDLILVARGRSEEVWSAARSLAKEEPTQVRAMKCQYSQRARQALGHGERAATGDFVVAINADYKISMADVRRLLSAFDSRFKILVGNLIPRKFQRLSDSMFGRDRWDMVGMWGYQRSEAPKGLMFGDVYRSLTARGSDYEHVTGQVDLSVKAKRIDLSFLIPALRSVNLLKPSTTGVLMPQTGGGAMLWSLVGVILLALSAMKSGVIGDVSSAMGLLAVVVGIGACTLRSFRPAEQGDVRQVTA